MGFREEVINIELARLLCEKGLNAMPENIMAHKKMPDIFILIDGVRIILEGKIENKEQLLRQTRVRVVSGLCEVAIALYYKRELALCSSLEHLVEKLVNYKYSGVIFYQDEGGIQEIQFDDIVLREINEIINNTTKLVLNMDILRSIVNYVEQAFEGLVSYAFNNSIKLDEKVVLDKLKDLLALDDINKLEVKYRKDVLRIAFFVLLDAMIFQEGLCNINSDIKSITYAHKPYKDYFQKAWLEIMKIDYKSVFEIAFQILISLPNGSQYTEDILKTIKDLSLKIINSGLLAKHDFMGRIYHRLLLKTTGQYYATYYTAVPSAYLLSNLLFKTYNANWNFNNIEFLKDFKVLDPACGSGTLLSASYNALRYIFSNSLDINEYLDFHKIMLEHVIYGWDVLSYAAHLTLTVLCLHNPSILINKSNVLKLPNGVDGKGKTCLGSITLMDPNLDLIDDKLNEPLGVYSIEGIEKSYLPFEIRKELFDVIIMNPPFSRSAKPNVKFGYSDEILKQAMSKELKKVILRNGLSGIGQAGLGAVFIALGKDMIKSGGRIGIIIPRAILSGVSWSKIRDILYKDFEIKYIISNYDTGNLEKGIEPWNWSEDTELGEVMIVGEKTDKDISEKETVFVNLWNKPEDEIDSIYYSHQISGKLLTGYITNNIFEIIKSRGKEVGAFYKIKQRYLEENWLMPCLFSSPVLNSLAIRLSDVFQTTKLSSILVNDGVDIKQIKDSFEQVNMETQYKIVWGQQSIMNRLVLDQRLVGNGVPKTDAAEGIYQKKSSFLLSERPHLSNDCIIAMKTTEEVLATAFWELKFKNPRVEAFMLLWFNSTPGLIMYLSASTNSMGEIFKTKKQQLKIMNVIDVNILSIDFLEKANDFYNSIKCMELNNFAMEFTLCSINSGIRKKIDDFIVKELEVNLDLRPYYKMLMREPAFTRERIIIPERNNIGNYKKTGS